jgi:hypothetical protein
MGIARILALGVAGVAAVAGAALFYHWQKVSEAARGHQILAELTPETLIVSCGQPESDEITYLPARGDGNDYRMPMSREIKYKTRSGWTKLSFGRGDDKLWHLRFFASPSAGVEAGAENAYIAIPFLPCLRKLEKSFPR